MNGSFEPRLEDHRLLTGAGRFPRRRAPRQGRPVPCLCARRMRLPISAARYGGGRRRPGVLAVLTAADLAAAGIGICRIPIPVPGGAGLAAAAAPVARRATACAMSATRWRWSSPRPRPRRATRPKRSRSIMRRATRSSNRPGRRARSAAPVAEAPGNLALDWHGPTAPKPAARAELDAHFRRRRARRARRAGQPAHRHGADGAARRRSPSTIARPTAITLHCASQSAFVHAPHSARTMGLAPVKQLRVISGDVGGAFGMRTSAYPEYPALLLAARN